MSSAQPPPSRRLVEEVGGGAVLLGEEVAVDAHGDVGVGVTEAAGHRPRVDAGTEQLGGDVVAQVVQSAAVEADLLPHADPAGRDVVGSPRAAAVDRHGEHERVGRQLDPHRVGPRRAHRPVVLETLGRARRQRHLPDLAGLGRLLDHADARPAVDHAPSERDGGGRQVDVGPPQRAQLRATRPGRRRQPEEHTEVGIELVDAGRARRPARPATGGVIRLGGVDGAVAASAGFDASRPHLSAWANAACRITCTLRTDPGDSGRPSSPPPVRSSA